MRHAIRFGRLAAVGLVFLSGWGTGWLARADETMSAPFPNKAAAILVQGSAGAGGDAAFGGDVTAMQGVFSSNTLNWKYNTLGANGIQTLTPGGAGAAQTSVANVGTALSNAAGLLWTTPVQSQNLVYYHSSHGSPVAPASNQNSNLVFGADTESADAFWKLVRDNFTSGHTQYSLNGATNTSCVRTMTYVLQGCYTGGYVSHLTTDLADSTLRKQYFPFLSDITVITAADANECALNNAGNTGSAFSQALYGFTDTNKMPPEVVPGALVSAVPVSAWSVYQQAARNDDGNPAAAMPAYGINAGFGAGNNSTMYVPGSRFFGGAQTEHPLYRHVRFYPAITYRSPAAADGIAVAQGADSLDFRTTSGVVPGNGFEPITLTLDGLSANDTLLTNREIHTQDTAPNVNFLDYYAFNLGFSNFTTAFGFGQISVFYNQQTDPTQIPANLANKLHLYEELSPGSGWTDTGATLDTTAMSLTADIGKLGQFALGVPVPEPAMIAMLLAGALLVTRRRRPN